MRNHFTFIVTPTIGSATINGQNITSSNSIDSTNEVYSLRKIYNTEIFFYTYLEYLLISY